MEWGDGMVDRERVIKGVECCAIDGGCGACPYDSFKDCPGSRPTPETLMRDALALLKEQEQKCRECGEATSKAIQELQTKLKAQEPPTDVSISSAIECLLHPQDADESDMAKAIDTAVRAMRLVKEQEPKPPTIKENAYGWKFYYCPSCGKEFYQNNKFSFCEKCGQAVKWDG